MALTVTQQLGSGSGDIASGSAGTVLTTNSIIGRCYVLCIWANSATSGIVTGVTSSIGTFVKVNAQAQTGANDTEIWICLAATGNAKTVTVSTTGAVAWAGQCNEVTGGVAGWLSAGTLTDTASTTPSQPFYQITNGSLVFAICSTSSSISTSPASPWTNYSQTGDFWAAADGLTTSYLVTSSSTAVNASFVLAGVGDWVTNGVILIPSAAPTVSRVGGSTTAVADAILTATVNPNGVDTTVQFNYGPTNTYGSSTSSVDIGSGTSPVTVQAFVTGLTPGSTYHFECAATNAVGTTDSADDTVTLGGMPQFSGILGQGELGAGILGYNAGGSFRWYTGSMRFFQT